MPSTIANWRIVGAKPKPRRRAAGPLDASVIEGISIAEELEDAGRQTDFDDRYVAELQNKVAALESELTRVTSKRTIDDIIAEMMGPYADKVFWFVVVYCVVVGLFLLLAGWSAFTKFHLSDTVLSIIAGSSLASVIGLMGMVIRGLFGGPGRPRKTKAPKAGS